MPETSNGAFEWKRTTEVTFGGMQTWMHDCGALGIYPEGFKPEWATPCGTCERDYGGWRPLLVEYTGRLVGNDTIKQDEADLDIALRIAPGSAHRHVAYRWRHVSTGTVYEELPARIDPRSNLWVREVAIKASVQGAWRPADTEGGDDDA